MSYEKDNYRNILELIYSYYPQSCSFTSETYKRSKEYLNYKRVLKDLNKHIDFGDKCYTIIKSIFKVNFIKQWNSIDYPSLHYSVLLHDNQSILDDDEELLHVLNGRRLDLEIYVSLISNYYYFFVIETKFLNNKLSFNYYEVKEFVSVNQVEHLDKEFNFMGYIRLERNIAILNVPNVETELLYEGEVKVFNCLFSDMEKHF